MPLLASLLVLIIFLLKANVVLAADHQFITVVNPVRGADFFQLKDTKPVDNVKSEWTAVKQKNLPATWLIRPDALSDSQIIYLMKSLPFNQEVGLFMEITPTWAKKAGVKYHQNANWHSAGSVFLTGYELEERKKLIDSAFDNFKSVFGYFPKSVGAWWIDGGSLTYMKDKYAVVANMDVADQYTTDNYQVWGQFFSTPFYPAKRNALSPAAGVDQKIGVVTIQWATRDPYNSYGSGVLDSTYSVQVNDYANKKYHSLGTDYFKKLLSIYLDNSYSHIGQVTVGLENDFSWATFGEEYTSQLAAVVERQAEGTKILTMSQFANSYGQIFPGVNAPEIIFASDPLGSGGQVLWYQNLNYRVGWFYTSKGSQIRDLKVFQSEENCLQKACPQLNLASLIRSIDEVTYGDEWIIDAGKISDISVSQLPNGVEINYTNQAGIKRKIAFLPNDVVVDGQPKTIASAIAEIASKTDKVTKEENNFSYQLKDGLGKVLWQQLQGLLWFLIFCIVFFLWPGTALFKKVEMEWGKKLVLGTISGLAVFTIASFVAGYLHFYWGLVLLPFFSLIYLKKGILKIFSGVRNLSFWPALVVILGSTSWLLTSVKNGLIYDYGMGFWGPSGHDGVWHLSLIEGLKNGLPLNNPVFSGEILKNYHFFYDLLLAATSALFGLNSLGLYFRYFPLLISVMIGVVGYLVVKEWFNSKLAAIISIFFLYFGGSWGWLVSYFKDKNLGGESLFWAQQGISTLVNPPFAISIVVFLAGLYLFQKILEQRRYNVSLVISLVILWGTLIEFKAYGGILVLGSLAVVTLVELLKNNWQIFKISLPVGFLSFAVFLPNNLGSSGLIMLMPFWLVHSMIDSVDRLNWLRLSQARMAGLESGNWMKYLGAEAIGLVVFLIGNLGARVIGILSINKLGLKNPMALFLISFTTLSMIIPLLFIQKGAAFNIIQFFYYLLVIFSLLAGGALTMLIKRFKLAGLVVTGLLIALTLPTTWDSLGQYLPARPPARIPLGEVQALEFLKTQPEGVVLSYFFEEKNHQKFAEPVPLFAYASTAYVGALSAQGEYIADTINLDIIDVDYKGRLQSQKDVLSFREKEVVGKLLKEGNINYIYIPHQMIKPSLDEFNLTSIYQNSEAEIFRIR